MRNLKGAVVAAAGLAAVVASLFSPSIPKSGAHVFTATNAGCEVREEGRQSLASFARGKIAGGPERGDSFDRVVRIYTPLGNNSYAFGTGYLIGGNYVLTAGHVANHGEPQAFFSNRHYPGKVLQIDSTADLGLVEISSDDGKGPTGFRIGNLDKGETAVVKTLDRGDARYQKGPDSHKEVKVIRYDGLSLPNASVKREVKELEKTRRVLEAEIYLLKTQEYQLLKPYFDPDGNYSPKKQKSNPIGQSIIKEESVGYYSYLGQTEKDRFVPSMSGSGMFNQSGELVGVAINIVERTPVSGGGSASGGVYIPGIPESVRQQSEDLSDKIHALTKIIREAENRLDQIKNPETPSRTYSGVSPRAITSFLEKACSRPKPIN